MIQEKQILLLKELQSIVEKRKQKEDSDGETYHIDSKRYTSPEHLEAERKTIFKQFPILVGPADRLKNPGDYFLHEWTGLPIAVIKGQDGEIRAFINQCRHRGVKLLDKAEGNIKRNIVCPYHAWSYDTAGCLKGVFHPQGFKDVSAESHSLIGLDCQVRFGLIFVIPDPELKGSYVAEDYFKELDAYITRPHMPLETSTYFMSKVVNCNWKLLVDGGLESYHFKVAHAKTIAPFFLDNMSLDQDNKLHSCTVYPKKAALETTKLDESEWNLTDHSSLVFNIFPNTIILFLGDHGIVTTFYPLDEKTTTVDSFMLIPKTPETEEEKKHWEMNYKIYWNAIDEDNEMAELQQKSFNGYDQEGMTVGSYEYLLVQFEKLIDQVVEGNMTIKNY